MADAYLSLEGLDAPVKLRNRRTAKRITLSVSRATGEAAMTVPASCSTAEARRFLEAHRGWLERHVAAAPGPEPFRYGMSLPFGGVETPVRRGGGRAVRLVGGALVCGAEDAALPGAMERFLKARAREALRARSRVHADALGVGFKRIALRDAKTRWGSCSSSGTLSYSWRMILAPPDALDYLAAHEVAHLREMNHGPRFWAHVAALKPDYERWRDWMRTRGPGLHRYGRNPEALEIS